MRVVILFLCVFLEKLIKIWMSFIVYDVLCNVLGEEFLNKEDKLFYVGVGIFG